MEYDVIVVGAGLSGGLPAAAYLQKAGLQVLLVEANAAEVTSGRASRGSTGRAVP